MRQTHSEAYVTRRTAPGWRILLLALACGFGVGVLLGMGHVAESRDAVRPGATRQTRVRDLEKTLLLGAGAATRPAEHVQEVTEAARAVLEQGHQLREGIVRVGQTPWLSLIAFIGQTTPSVDEQLRVIERFYRERHGQRLPERDRAGLEEQLGILGTRLVSNARLIGEGRVIVLVNLDEPLKPLLLAESQTERGPLQLFAKGGSDTHGRSAAQRGEAMRLRPPTINLTLTASYASPTGLTRILQHERANLLAGAHVENDTTTNARGAARRALARHETAYQQHRAVDAESVDTQGNSGHVQTPHSPLSVEASRRLQVRILETEKFLSVFPHDERAKQLITLAAVSEIIGQLGVEERPAACARVKAGEGIEAAFGQLQEVPDIGDAILEVELGAQGIDGEEAADIRRLWQSIKHLHRQVQIVGQLTPRPEQRQDVLEDAFTVAELLGYANYDPDWGAMGAGKIPIPGPASQLYPKPMMLSPVFGRLVAERLLVIAEAQQRQAIRIWELGAGRGHLAHDVLAGFAELHQEAVKGGNEARRTLLEQVSYHAIERDGLALAELRQRNARWIESGAMTVIEEDAESYLQDRPPGSIDGTVLTYDFFDGLPFDWLDVQGGAIRQVAVLPVIPRRVAEEIGEVVLAEAGLSLGGLTEESGRMEARYGFRFPGPGRNFVLPKASYLALRRALARPDRRPLEGALMTWTTIVELLLDVDSGRTPELADYVSTHGHVMREAAKAHRGPFRVAVAPGVGRIMTVLGRAMAPEANLLSMEMAVPAATRIPQHSLLMHPGVIEGGINPYCLLGEFLVFTDVDLDMWEASGQTAGVALVSNEPTSTLDVDERFKTEAAKRAVIETLRGIASVISSEVDEAFLEIQYERFAFLKNAEARLVLMRKQGPAGRDPAVTSAGGADPRDVDHILSQIETLLGHGKEGNMIEVYLQQIRLLRTLGLLTKETKLFNLLSGFDLFPGLHVGEMWTSDYRVSEAQIATIMKEFVFGELGEHVKAEGGFLDDPRHFGLVEPMPRVDDLVRIHHDPSNVFEDGFVARWTNAMRPGDVVWLRAVPEFLVQWDVSAERLQRWVDQFIKAVPEGVTVVVYDRQQFDEDRQKAVRKAFPDGLASYLMSSGYCVDQVDALLSSSQRRRFEDMNARVVSTDPRMLNVKILMGGQKIDFPFGGRLSVLQKTQRANRRVAAEEAGPTDAQGAGAATRFERLRTCELHEAVPVLRDVWGSESQRTEALAAFAQNPRLTEFWIRTHEQLQDEEHRAILKVFKETLRGQYVVTMNDIQDSATDWARIFGNDGAIRVEIGFGRGRQLVEAAKNHPDANVIGIELSLERADERGDASDPLLDVFGGTSGAGLGYFFEWIETIPDRPGNLRVIEADAREVLAKALPRGALAHIGIYFPSVPASRTGELVDIEDVEAVDRPAALFPRMASGSNAFVTQLYDALEVGGIIEIVTESVPYAEQMKGQFERDAPGPLTVELSDGIPPHVPQVWASPTSAQMPGEPRRFDRDVIEGGLFGESTPEGLGPIISALFGSAAASPVKEQDAMIVPARRYLKVTKLAPGDSPGPSVEEQVRSQQRTETDG